MQFLKNYQLEIMFVLEWFCLLLAVFGLIMKIEPKKKKFSLIGVELATMILLWADRNAYIFRGNTTQLGYYMVRITNFIVFAILFVILDLFNTYMLSYLEQFGKNDKSVKFLKVVRPIACAGLLLVIISQFTGFYYTFDAQNLYHRSKGFLIGFIFPFIILILQFFVLLKIRWLLRRSIFNSIIVFTLMPVLAAVLQTFLYGLSLINISIGLSAILLYVLAIVDRNQVLEEASQKEIDNLIALNTVSKEQFRQTALALATAIDAKDKYTHGHSRRVAEYSRQIAQSTGKSLDTCEKVYFAALLHDVGKIGISDLILTKEGRLTDEEFSVIKQHPDFGNNILKEISSSPYLSVGAHYHHERYDGKGYPEGLKGTDIPELARIIAVADAYDAMTSSRSYRTPLAQQKVREELVRGFGTQFDPEYATAMIHILDKDTEYDLRDYVGKYDGILEEYTFDENSKDFTEGIAVTDHITRISFSYESLQSQDDCVPSLIVFDSLDECVYTDEYNRNKMDYTGFCDISFNGKILPGKIRNCHISEYPNDAVEKTDLNEVVIETVKQKDHVLVKMFFAEKIREYTIALMDRSQWVFTAVTGKNCVIKDFKVHKFEQPVEENYIRRIADEVSYISGKEEGDVKNLEITGWREKHSEGILLDKKLELKFQTMSLPASKRLWHCPIAIIYTSENGAVMGPGYREFAQLRFDGETWTEDVASSSEMKVSFDEKFVNWDTWKEMNRNGLECSLTMEKENNKIFMTAENGGVNTKAVTTISEDIPNIYFALTGDQVAITAIKIIK